MSESNTPLKSIGVIQETAKYYLEKRFDSFKLQMAKQSSQITSSLITTMVLMGLGLVLYIFVLLTIGLLLGQYWESYALGFAAVSIIVAITISGIYFFRATLVTRPVMDQVLSQVDFDHVNNKAELELEQRKIELMQQMAEDIIVNEVNAIPANVINQILNKKVLSSQAATMAAYAIQTAANHFVVEQSQKANLNEWWKPFMPVLIDFAKDYLEEYLAKLKLNSSPPVYPSSSTIPDSNPSPASQQAINLERPNPRPNVTLPEVKASA